MSRLTLAVASVAVVAGTTLGLPLGATPQAASADTWPTAVSGPAVPGQNTLQRLSDIQSRRWKPGSLYASEFVITNSHSVPLYHDASSDLLDNGRWHRPPPEVIQPGETVVVSVESTKTGKGFRMGLRYTAGSPGADESVRLGTENLALRKNVYLAQPRSVNVAAVDGRNNAWVPPTRPDGAGSRVDSDTLGKSNWGVVAWDVAPAGTAAGHGLPRGAWSSNPCTDYRRVAKDIGWGDGLTGRLGNPASAWHAGLVGAQAGAFLGSLVNGCR